MDLMRNFYQHFHPKTDQVVLTCDRDIAVSAGKEGLAVIWRRAHSVTCQLQKEFDSACEAGEIRPGEDLSSFVLNENSLNALPEVGGLVRDEFGVCAKLYEDIVGLIPCQGSYRENFKASPQIQSFPGGHDHPFPVVNVVHSSTPQNDEAAVKGTILKGQYLGLTQGYSYYAVAEPRDIVFIPKGCYHDASFCHPDQRRVTMAVMTQPAPPFGR